MLKKSLKILLAASIAMPAFLVADLAQAGHKKKNRNHNKQHYSKNYNGHNSNRHQNRRYNNNYKRNNSRHYSPRYTYYPSTSYYGGNYYGGHYSNRHRRGNAGTYASLAILGATLGLIIHNSSKNKNRSSDNYNNQPPPQNYQQQQQGYTQSRPDSFDFSQCQDTRGYETTIIVDGQEQQAYGTACMLDDGTWVAGPMMIE